VTGGCLAEGQFLANGVTLSFFTRVPVVVLGSQIIVEQELLG